MYDTDRMDSPLRTRFQEFTDFYVRSFSPELVSKLVLFFSRELLQSNHLLRTPTDLESLELCSASPQLEMEECKHILSLLFTRYKRVYNKQLRSVARALKESGVGQEVLDLFVPEDDSVQGNTEAFESFLKAQNFDFTVQIKERLESIQQNIVEIHECKVKKMLSQVKNLRPSVISLGEQIVADSKALMQSIEEHLLTEIATRNTDRLITFLDSLLEQDLVSQLDMELAFSKSLEEIWLYMQSVEAFVVAESDKDQEAAQRQVEEFAQKGSTFAMMQVAKRALEKGEKPSKLILQYLLEINEKGEEESFDTQCFLELTDEEYPSSYQEKAIAFLKQVAATGHGEALTWLGIHYAEGGLVEENFSKAYDYFVKGADAGSALAMLKLADCYCQGFGVEQNFEKAFEYLERGSIRQDRRCAYEMSIFLEKGIGTEKDLVRALRYRDFLPEEERMSFIFIDRLQENLRLAAATGSSEEYLSYARYLDLQRSNYSVAKIWYEKAAKHKNQWAMFRLGELFEEGLGVEKDFKRALRYYLMAAREGHVEAMEKAGIMLTFTEEVKNPRRGEQFLSLPAECGNMVAQFYYARYLEEIKKNSAMAKVWYRKAVEQDYTEAMYFLAGILENEEENKEEAIALYRQASSSGNLMALLDLGKLLMQEDHEKGLGYIREAAEKGNPQAQIYYAGILKESGDVAGAHTWLQKAVEQGEEAAFYCMATLHLTGEGCEQNIDKAYSLLKEGTALAENRLIGFLRNKITKDLRMYNRIMFKEE